MTMLSEEGRDERGTWVEAMQSPALHRLRPLESRARGVRSTGPCACDGPGHGTGHEASDAAVRGEASGGGSELPGGATSGLAPEAIGSDRVTLVDLMEAATQYAMTVVAFNAAVRRGESTQATSTAMAEAYAAIKVCGIALRDQPR